MAKLHEAVALSLNIEPSKLRLNLQNLMGGNRFDESVEFNDRLFLANRCLGDTLPGPHNALAVQYHSANPVVRLRDFVVWAQSVGWELPDKLGKVAPDIRQRRDTVESPGSSAAVKFSDQTTYHKGLAGKPTSWHLIEQELRRRYAAGERHPSIAEWAGTLRAWLKESHPSAPCPKPKTLANRLSPVLRDLRSVEIQNRP